MTTTTLTAITRIRAYIFGGESTFTIVSVTRDPASGARFTYKVSQKKGATDFFFVSLLTGPENQDDYTPCGTIRREGETWSYRTNRSALSWVREDAPSQVAMRWLAWRINQPKDLGGNVEFWTSGKCSSCGRKLTTPESIERGMGPKCATRAMRSYG